MGRLRVSEQTRSLQQHTNFVLKYDLPWKTVWVGYVKPFDLRYDVSITLYHGHRLKFTDAKLFVPTRKIEVIIENPQLEITLTEALAAHFYFNQEEPARSPLCLYHPSIGERWHPDKYISQTIVPWTIQHMAAYEIWKDIGIWNLPEEHPDGSTDKGSSADKGQIDESAASLKPSKMNSVLMLSVSLAALKRTIINEMNKNILRREV